MGQLALTFWFTVATLFGPSLLCCCSSATAAPKAVAAPKPVKSCCLHDAPAEQKPPPAPAKEKPKCPCQSKASAEALLTGVETTDELATQFGGAAATFVELSLIPFDSIRSSDVVTVPTFPTSPPLSGRALLAAYSILRC